MSTYNKCKECGKNCRKEFCHKHVPKDEKLEYFEVPEETKPKKSLACSQALPPKVEADRVEAVVEQDNIAPVEEKKARKSRAANQCAKCGKPSMGKYCAAHNRTVAAKAEKAAAITKVEASA